MTWQIELTKKADKQLGKLGFEAQQQIVSYLEHITKQGNPQAFGKPLVGDFSGYWRYRVGKYRIICDIQHHRLIIEVIAIGKRDSIYD